jgi:hypothetical protein
MYPLLNSSKYGRLVGDASNPSPTNGEHSIPHASSSTTSTTVPKSDNDREWQFPLSQSADDAKSQFPTSQDRLGNVVTGIFTTPAPFNSQEGRGQSMYLSSRSDLSGITRRSTPHSKHPSSCYRLYKPVQHSHSQS